MKQITVISIITLLFAIFSFAASAQTSQRKEQNMNTKKTLVAFFSRTGENYAVGHIEKGNTHILAEMIAAETDGDLFHIKPVTPYPDDYTECTEVAKRELNVKARPAVKESFLFLLVCRPHDFKKSGNNGSKKAGREF